MEASGLEKLQGGGENLKDERGEWSNLIFLHFSETSLMVAHLCEGSFMTMCACFVFFRFFGISYAHLTLIVAPHPCYGSFDLSHLI